MKAHDLREKTLDEVNNDLVAAQENLSTIRFQLVTSQLENTSLYKRAKRDVARLKTVLREHERGIRTLAGSREISKAEDVK